jgi:hypothetical protein
VRVVNLCDRSLVERRFVALFSRLEKMQNLSNQEDRKDSADADLFERAVDHE